jgi:hypothetical protein
MMASLSELEAPATTSSPPIPTLALPHSASSTEASAVADNTGLGAGTMVEETGTTGAVDHMGDADIVRVPTRRVVCGDALAWMSSQEQFPAGCGVFTSLPDITELSGVLGRLSVNEYKEWFIDTVSLTLSRLPKNSYAIFLQSPVRVTDDAGGSGRVGNSGRGGQYVIEWIDKSHLCSIAADRSNCRLYWSKIALLSNMSKKSCGRPTYSNMVCYGKGEKLHYRSSEFSTPDIFERGEMLWPKGIGINTVLMGVAFLKDVAKANLVVDPFCGKLELKPESG